MVVALRKESVDRNANLYFWRRGPWLSLSARRAWIEIIYQQAKVCPNVSLSARRAWIEICGGAFARPLAAVALRKESVDRNYPPIKPAEIGVKSLSARRAWIEIK